jgi:hypothetical protein
MLYQKKEAATLDIGLFQNPTKEYRAAPFWSWNCELKKEVLEKQIEIMKEMGFGGYYMHTRVGMATPYLSDEFMDLVGACIEKGKEIGMNSYLYDEDRWPSGTAGGFTVQASEENRQKFLHFTYHPYNDGTLVLEEDIANARKYYNAVVKQFNNRCEMFPSNILANMFNFERKPMFEVDAEEERQNVKVEF